MSIIDKIRNTWYAIENGNDLRCLNRIFCPYLLYIYLLTLTRDSKYLWILTQNDLKV